MGLFLRLQRRQWPGASGCVGFGGPLPVAGLPGVSFSGRADWEQGLGVVSAQTGPKARPGQSRVAEGDGRVFESWLQRPLPPGLGLQISGAREAGGGGAARAREAPGQACSYWSANAGLEKSSG